MAQTTDRKCNGCTACCEGWLTGEALGKKFFPGCKCHFLGEKGCTVYNKRPIDPCVNYKCEWLKDNEFPEWFKPSESGVILTKRERDGVKWLEVTECGKKIDSAVLTWLFINYVIKSGGNLRWQLSGAWNFIGDKNFCEIMARK